MTLIPFAAPALKVPKWGELVEATPPPLDSIVDPSSDPYVQVSELSPTPGQVNVPADSSIVVPCGDKIPEDKRAVLVDLLNPVSPETDLVGLDSSKTIIRVQYDVNPSFVVFENGAPVGGWSMLSVPNDYSGYERDAVAGFTYTFAPPTDLPAYTLVTIETELWDYSGHQSVFSHSFSTATGFRPYLVLCSPAPGSVRNPPDGLFSFAIIENDGSVIPSTIRIYVRGALAFNGATSSFLPPFDGGQSLFETDTYEGFDGYKLTFARTSDFPSYQLVEVRGLATNVIGNEMDETYSFRIADMESPVFAHIEPEPGSVDVGRNTLIRVSVYDAGSGLKPHSVAAWVMNRVVFDGYDFISPFDGPGSSFAPAVVDGYDGYQLVVAISGQYPSSRPVDARVVAEDNEGN
jgi:hypothetical protein